MFTGIIEEIGIIKEFKKGETALIVVECKKILEDVKIGDSVSINGVCQTVVAFDKNTFSAQLSSETLGVTTFSKSKCGDKVNLERALTLNARLGGHLVSGHVDGLAKIKTIQKQLDFYNLKFETEKELTKYIAKKGSITINGISLTVAGTDSAGFSAAIIPHTFGNTNLTGLKTGDYVNIEVDILAKYVEKFLSTGNNGKNQGVDESFLKDNGFF